MTALRVFSPRNPTAIARYIVIVAIGFVLVFPLLYLVSLSLMTAHDVAASPPNLIPPSFEWSNFSQAYSFLSGRTILNSFIFTLGVLVLQLGLSLPAGFALAQIPFRGSGFMTSMFVIPMFLPTNVFVITLFVVAYKLQLINTYAGLIIPIAGSTAFGTLLFRQYFVKFPRSLIEAARLDGAGWFRTLWTIAIPLAKPAVAAYSAVTFVTAWNLYIWPQLVATDPALRVMPVALAPLAQSTYNTIPASVGYAAAVLTALPVVIAFLVAQRWFLNAIVGTGSVE